MRVRYCVADSAAVLAGVGDVSLAGAAAVRRRADFRHAQDGDDHVAARILARLLLASTVAPTRPEEWELTQECPDPRCRRPDPHGRPSARLAAGRTASEAVRADADAVAVSWSHAHGVLACAVAVGAGRIGVDAETVRPVPPLPGRGWRAWVRGEALVKAGCTDLDAVLDLPLEHEPSCVPMPDGLGASGWLCDFDASAGRGPVVGAIATRATVRPVLRAVSLGALLTR